MRGKWFKAALVIGFLLGVFLLIESAFTYRYVADHLVMDHLANQAGRQVSVLETRAREGQPRNPHELQVLLDDFRRQGAGQVDWVRVSDRAGVPMAVSGQPDTEGVRRETARDLLDLKTSQVVETRDVAGEEILVVAMPFRYRFPAELPAPGQRGPRFKLAEIAISLRQETGVFLPLRRNLAITVAGSIALLMALALVALRMKSYLKGRELEQQLAVARRVQAELLPEGCPHCPQLDFGVAFRPSWEVGGDYYDVFLAEPGHAVFVVADVSGKGLPAALLAGVVQGALRTSAALAGASSQVGLAHQLNRFLCSQTSGERYVTLFWAFHDPSSRTLKYVNGGHLPPLLLRATDRGHEKHRLQTGGPVLGLLTEADYEQGAFELEHGDLLVLYSDGVVEAADQDGVEFGEDRLVEAVEAIADLSPQAIVDGVLKRLAGHVGTSPIHDDVTLLVIRFQDRGPSRQEVA